MKTNLLITALFLSILVVSTSAFAIENPGEELQEVGLSSKLGENIDLSLEFTDSTGKKVTLQDYFTAGKPVILTPVYYTCPRLCGLVLSGVANLVKELKLSTGEEYQLLTFSFKPEESPELAAKRQKIYLQKAGYQEQDISRWPFLVGQQERIDALLDQIGFRAKRDNDDYAHTGALIVLTPEGKISQYFTGIEFPSFDVRLSLVEASEGNVGNALDHVLLFCFRFDPTKGKYTWAAFNVMRAGGILTLLLLGILFWKLTRKEKKELSKEG